MQRADRAERFTDVDVRAAGNAFDQQPRMHVCGRDELRQQYQRGDNRSDTAPAFARITDGI